MTATSQPAAVAGTRMIAGAISLYIAGGLFWAFLPFFVSLQMQRGDLSPAAAGLLGTAYLLGFTASSMLAVWWAPRIAVRPTIAVTAIVIAVAFWILGASPGIVPGLAACFVLGNAMGALWVVAYRILGLARVPDRAFAIAIGISYPALALVTFVAGRWIIPRSGLGGVMLTIAVLVGVLSLGGTQAPRRLTTVAPPGAMRRDGLRGTGVLALASLFLTGFAFACIWSFAARIGLATGIDARRVGAILSSNLLLTGIGSLIASAMVGRTTRLLPLVAALTVLGGCTALLALPLTETLFTVALVGLGFGIGAVMPYQLANVADADRTGALTSLIAAVQGAGSALGPPVAGLLWQAGGASAIAGSALGLVLASAAASLLVARRLSGAGPSLS